MTDCTITFVTCGKREEAERIAESLVSERLAACVNIVPGVTSVYVWEEKLCKESEWLLVIKSSEKRGEELQRRVRSLHSYSVPEIVTVPIESGSSDYLRWVKESTA